jgi:hypothetical protein
VSIVFVLPITRFRRILVPANWMRGCWLVKPADFYFFEAFAFWVGTIAER